MNDTAGGMDTEIQDSAEEEQSPSGATQRVWLFLRRHGRNIWYSYAAVLLLVTSVQAVCMLLIFRSSEEWARSWASFGRDFATSPAAAGICAVIAASLGAWQLTKQLNHSKDKAAQEAWWQQFEWVTDRIISSSKQDEKDDIRLPSSLALDLMNSLAASASKKTFQKAAVAGILKHYLQDSGQARTDSQDEGPTPNGPATKASGGPILDSEGAESLRNLMKLLPESSRAPARIALQAYENDYEDEGLKALRHRLGDAIRIQEEPLLGISAVISKESERIAVKVQAVRDSQMLEDISQRLQLVMGQVGASSGVIITTPTNLNVGGPTLKKLFKNGMIHLVEWDPSEGSSALHRRVMAVHRHHKV